MLTRIAAAQIQRLRTGMVGGLAARGPLLAGHKGRRKQVTYDWSHEAVADCTRARRSTGWFGDGQKRASNNLSRSLHGALTHCGQELQRQPLSC